MKQHSARFALVLMAVFFAVNDCRAQQPKERGGFRAVLDVVGIAPQSLEDLAAPELSEANWETLAQLVERLRLQASELAGWTLQKSKISAENVGEVFSLEGTVEQVQEIAIPESMKSRLEVAKLYRTQVKLDEERQIQVVTIAVPKQWPIAEPITEQVSFFGVLCSTDEPTLFVATQFQWFPSEGLATGKILLARFGMDASLWDAVVQRAPFIQPNQGREAEAFYACLRALTKVPPAELAKFTTESIAAAAKAIVPSTNRRDALVADSITRQAALGLSSVAPLFLKPENQVGELVRIEGTARRAIRISAEGETPPALDSIQEYFEVEVFTPDSQNLPLVCCVAALPADFPLGDAIREGVRLDGVFFKSWRYRSRQLVEGRGETATQQQRYTPIILAPTITWIRQTESLESWWGIVVGGAVFALMIGGLLRMLMSKSRGQGRSTIERPPDFSQV